MSIIRTLGIKFGARLTKEILKLVNGTVGVSDAYYQEILGEVVRHEIASKYERLSQNLDSTSQEILDESMNRLVEGLTVRNGRYSVLSSEQIQNLPLYNAEKKLYYKTKLKPKEYLPEVFYYHHGLRYCNPLIHKYIQGKCFLDCGAYVGDSAIVLSQYQPSKIYCFEFAKQQIKYFKTNIRGGE